MGNMKTKTKTKFYRIICALLLTAFLGSFISACNEKNAFNGRGSAEINLEFNEDYDGLFIQCPNGIVTGSGKNYKITLRTRALVDVIISCEGYETLTLRFLTAEIISGSITKNDISLFPILSNV